MRLIFYYLQHKHADKYFDFLKTEGYFYLLKRMVETGIIDEVLIIIDSDKSISPFKMHEGIVGQTVQGIMQEPEGGFRSDDIIWVRGGWRSWHDFLVKKKEEGHKLLLYAANSGRERWPFWDIIFDDINGKESIDSLGRRSIDFRKPTNPDMFYPLKIERKYDFCIGASHIHDKKGQWRAIEVLIKYKELYGNNPKCIMPGSIKRGVKTNNILRDIEASGIDVFIPGMLSRQEMLEVYNSSKVFVHMGSGGQGDRGVLEAMSCGCSVVIGSPNRHSPSAVKGSMVLNQYSVTANVFFYGKALVESTEQKRDEILAYHKSAFGVENVILPSMKKLFKEIQT